MLKSKTNQSTPAKLIRIWPGVIAAILLIVIKYIVPLFVPDSLPIAMFGGVILGLLIIIWWAFFSRTSHPERWGALVLMIVSLIAIRPFLHHSLANAGMGVLFYFLAIPVTGLALVAWAVVTRHLPNGIRRMTLVATILLAIGGWALLRTGGLNADADSDFMWRWTTTPEERLLAQPGNELKAPHLVITEETGIEWPGFRGANRDGIVHGVRIATDWTTSPPAKLWQKSIGPGWSSFSVRNNLFYTQEQRGKDELVSCYNLQTGELVWKHQDEVRFWESNSGAGPRATPTLGGDRVYAFGATGILNVLDINDGHLVWSRNVAADTETKVPYWGFSSSPLVLDDIVIVAAAGSIIAYDLNTGNPRWSKQAGGDCYSSPHIFQIGSVNQILLQNDAGTISFSPADGAVLWEHAWPGHPIVQPTMTADGDILISTDERTGIRRIAVAQGSNGWKCEERWTSDVVKPYFNDSVIHNGYVYGFDGRALACIDIKDGSRQWKGGRYGRGQLILLADQDLLLVISEKGDLALVNAVPDQFTELTRLPAIKGKTWNHPVLVGDILLVRNAQEMAAFKLTLAGV
ncbi:PQQ-binding-like beta-propeller repeat protein [candidate division KSB1 bacterium]|nr:PQQ-binding-like beta-propeller repeat protein [candidate division KSB1 bacterium]